MFGYCPGSEKKALKIKIIDVTLTYGWGCVDNLIRKVYLDVFGIDSLGMIE